MNGVGLLLGVREEHSGRLLLPPLIPLRAPVLGWRRGRGRRQATRFLGFGGRLVEDVGAVDVFITKVIVVVIVIIVIDRRACLAVRA